MLPFDGTWRCLGADAVADGLRERGSCISLWSWAYGRSDARVSIACKLLVRGSQHKRSNRTPQTDWETPDRHPDQIGNVALPYLQYLSVGLLDDYFDLMPGFDKCWFGLAFIENLRYCAQQNLRHGDYLSR